MKICLINNLYRPYSRGGAEKVVEMTARGLKEQGHKVFVITADPHLNPPDLKVSNPSLPPLKLRGGEVGLLTHSSGGEVGLLTRSSGGEVGSLSLTQEGGGGLRIYRVYSPNLVFYGNLGKLPMPFRLIWHFLDMFNVPAAWKVRKIIKQEKPDVVFLHNLKGLSYLIPKFLGNENLVFVPHDVQLVEPSGIIFYPHLNPPPEKQGEEGGGSVLLNLYKTINQFLFGDIKKVIFPSKWLLDFYAKNGFFKKTKKVVLHNPTLSFLPHLDPPPQRGGGEEGVSNLLFVGQLEESKGIIFLINALKDFRFQISDFRLTIVGAGSKRQQMEKLIEGDRRFKYIGKLSGDDLQKIYGEADYTIVPSLTQENCPTVILESFAAGTPVIASRTGGTPELIQHGENGLLFNAGDALNLIELLERLPNIDWQKMSEAAQSSAKIHAIDRYINLLLNFSHEEDGQNALEREPCQMCQQGVRQDDHEEI